MLADFGARDRVLSHLVAATVALECALAELTTEEASPLLPVEPELQALLVRADSVIKRLAH